VSRSMTATAEPPKGHTPAVEAPKADPPPAKPPVIGERQFAMVGGRETWRVYSECPETRARYWKYEQPATFGGVDGDGRQVAPLQRWRHERSPAAEFLHLVSDRRLSPLPPRESEAVEAEAVEAEADKLDAAGFATAAKMLREGHAARPAVPAGSAVPVARKPEFEVAPALWIPFVEFYGLIDRHASGDFGTLGTFDDIEVSDEARFCPPLFSPAVQSAVAVESGEGIVRSRLEIPSHTAAGLSRQGYRTGDAIDVVTLLRDGQPQRTVCLIRRS
jgi:hypothetical protein